MELGLSGIDVVRDLAGQATLGFALQRKIIRVFLVRSAILWMIILAIVK